MPQRRRQLIAMLIALSGLAPSIGAVTRVEDGLECLYLFDEGDGDAVFDEAGLPDPIDLTIADPTAVAWRDGSLVLLRPTILLGAEPPTRLMSACQASGEISVEAWLAPRNAEQDGPARIVTLSTDPGHRNFTLGQEREAWDVRLRTTTTGENGSNPSLRAAAGEAPPAPMHLIFTRDADGACRFYRDGALLAERTVPGDLRNWAGDFHLAVGNEPNDERTWLGEVYFAAAYEFSLEADEVARRYVSGRDTHRPARTPRLGHDPLVLYTFEEGEGSIVRDRSGAEPALDLRIEDPDRVAWRPDGLAITGSTRLVSDAPAGKIVAACFVTGELTIEAWVRPANRELSGPARIFTLSRDGGTRNWTLGQEKGNLVVRLRTSQTNENGTDQEWQLADAITTAEPEPGAPLHLAYTRSADGLARLYINGRLAREERIQGDLTPWDHGMRLALGNEITLDRPWLGRLHLVAIYSRALSPDEVERNHAAGPGD